MKLPRRLLSRKLWITLGILVAAYGIAGFWLVPRLVVQGLHEYLEVKHQRHARVGTVRFNPFTLRLEVNQLAVDDADGQPLVGFASLAADVRARSVLRGGIEFAYITLDQPHVRLVERKGGGLNIMDLVPPSSDPNSPMPKVWINSLRVAHGDAEFTDLNRLHPFQVAVNAFNLELDDFYTRSPANVYRVTARSRLEAVFAFSGTFGLDPVASTGELHIGNFRAQSIADAGPNLLPLDLPHGTLDVNARYDFGRHGQDEGLILDVSDLTLHDVGLRAPGQQDTWVEISEAAIRDAHVDLAAATAKVGRLRIEGARINAWLERGGALNLARLYVPLPDEPAAPDAKPAPPAKPWQMSLPQIEVVAADIALADRGPRHPVALHLAPLNVTVSGFSLPSSTPFEVTSEATLNDTGHASVHATLGLDPLAGHAEIELATLPLQPLQPYIESQAALRVRSGSLSFKGTAELAAGGGVTVDGDGTVDALRTTDEALEEDFVKWSSVRLAGLHATTNPTSVRIREILARQPYARVIVGSNGKTNLSVVLHGDSGEAAATSATTAPAAKPVPIEIGVVRVEGGSMNFADYSVKPQFATGIHDLGGSIRGVSSNPGSRATIALDGKVDRYAPVHIAGDINPFAAANYADVKMSFKNLELTGMSPYSGKFAGYWIDKGKMSAELDYRVVDRRVDANHHIVVDQLTLGQHVDSADATKLPVKLAIALLKDKDGVIDLELPMKGSLDDPDFRIGKVVWKVVVNLLEKAVTSPFRLLGSLFGGGDQMEYIEFSAGNATLDEAARTRVAALVKALGARPGLSIDIPMGIAADFDTPALATAKFEADLAARAAARQNADPADPAVLARLRADPAAYRSVLEEAYVAAFGHKPSVPAQPKDTPADAVRDAAISWLEGELRARITVSPRDLDGLASARAAAVQSALLEGTGIDPGRVFMVKAPQQAVEGGHVKLKLALH